MPSVKEYENHNYDFVVLASDGVWDFCTFEEGGETIKLNKNDVKACARALVDRAVSNGSTDDKTAVVIRIK